jgi:hypothetical protein
MHPYGGYKIVEKWYAWRILAANNLGFGYRLWLKSAKLLANAVPRGHDMSKISHTQPSQHQSSLNGPIWRI